jgi:predicted nucleic acid-binding protein
VKISLDANILVYAVDLADAQKHARAVDVVTRAAASGRAALSEQALFEFLHAVIRKLAFPRDKAFAMVSSWQSYFETMGSHASIFQDTASMMQRYNVNVWDARLLAMCNAGGVTVLLSEDFQDAGRYGRVLVIDPFEPVNNASVDAVLT